MGLHVKTEFLVETILSNERGNNIINNLESKIMEKKMIWSSKMLYDDEARENYLENMRVITEDEDYQLTDKEWADEVYIALSDERGNLDKRVNGTIIAFADLGLWQGRRIGYQILGNNIANILYSQCDDAEWYGNTYNIRGIQRHHDGTNYVLYRIAKDEETAERIAAKIYNGEIDERGFRKLTRSLYPDVAAVYGWKIAGWKKGD